MIRLLIMGLLQGGFPVVNFKWRISYFFVHAVSGITVMYVNFAHNI